MTTTTASPSASAAKNNTANATCAKNSPSVATAPRHRHRIADTTNLAYEGRGLGAIGDIDSNLFYIDNRQKAEGETVRIKTQGFNLGLTTPLGDSGHRVKYGLNQRQEKASPGTHETAKHDQKKATSAATSKASGTSSR